MGYNYDRRAASSRLPANAKVTKVPISDIKPGDTVLHHGEIKTVTRSSLGGDNFMGRSLWGDSYKGGRQLVQKVNFAVPLPGGRTRIQ